MKNYSPLDLIQLQKLKPVHISPHNKKATVIQLDSKEIWHHVWLGPLSHFSGSNLIRRDLNCIASGMCGHSRLKLAIAINGINVCGWLQ